eukprot:SAG22_NODE_12961_length_423_cov_1.388889_1_plen_106_part_01
MVAAALPEGYSLECLTCPLAEPEAWADEVVSFLCSGEFGPGFAATWGADLRRRCTLPGTVVATVRCDSAVVAHAMVAYDPSAVPSVGLVGHVYTDAGHRRKGLSRT